MHKNVISADLINILLSLVTEVNKLNLVTHEETHPNF